MTIDEFKNEVMIHQDKLFRFALGIVKDKAVAQDVVQEVFIKIWETMDSYSHVTNWGAWSMRLVKNKSIDKLRSKHNRVSDIDMHYDLKDNTISPYKVTEGNDTMSWLEKLMENLPETQRMVMKLRDIEEFKYQEIADALEISLDQVKVNLFRARKKMKQLVLKNSEYGQK